MTNIKKHSKTKAPATHTDWYVAAMEKLVAVVQELSQARDLDAVMAVVRKAARDLTSADGATFVLRDDDKCYYAEENAISPLWKGQRFPMKTCISGWVMLNAQPAIIEDIYKDPRIPEDAYRPTFVKSLAMVPIRSQKPVGAIGNYWAKNRMPSDEEVAILQTLANFTSVAMENVALYTNLQNKLEALQKSNHELGSFAWAASHDLKTPLRGIDNLSGWIEEDFENGEPEKVKEHVASLRRRVRRMESLLDSILEYAQAEHTPAPDEDEAADGETLKKDILELTDLPDVFTLRFAESFGRVSLPRIAAQRVFANLIGNAVKHHDKDTGLIEIDVRDEGPNYVFTVKDDGPGIPPAYRDRIFEMFQTLKTRDATEGSGMGLALVKKILSVYGGNIALEEPEGARGAIFRLTWPKDLGHSQQETA